MTLTLYCAPLGNCFRASQKLIVQATAAVIPRGQFTARELVVTDNLEIDLDPLDDDDLADLRAVAAGIKRTGENVLAQLHYEGESQRLEQKLSDWIKAIAKAKLNSDDQRLERATKIMAQLTTELAACRYLFLKSWCPDRRYPN